MMLLQIREMSGEHASEHFADQATIFKRASQKLEYSLAALVDIIISSFLWRVVGVTSMQIREKALISISWLFGTDNRLEDNRPIRYHYTSSFQLA